MRLRIGFIVLVIVVYAHAQTCKVHNDCPDTHANRHCCNGQCGNCRIRCRNDDNCLSKYNDACCFKPETNFGSCMKRPEPGKRECWYEESSGSDPVTVTLSPTTNPSITQPPVTDPPITQTRPPTTVAPGSTLPYENRCFVSGQCSLPNYVCCWDTGRPYGHCSPKDSAPSDCFDASVTQGPGHQRCFNSDQCSRINEPPNCCPEKGKKWGYCKRSCNDPLPENRCFLDKMCTTADSVCCWRSNDIHGNCYKRESAPSECQQQPLTQQPGLHLCYNSFQCTFYGLSQPQECCYAIGDTPGLCQSSCSATSPSPAIDPRCFVDIHCNDMNNLVCCWKLGSIHGQCTRKEEAPEDCGLYKPPTIRPNEQNCYNDWQCKLSGSPPKCCGANGENFGQCKNQCESSDVTSTPADPRCFVDAMCEDSNKVCCWSEGAIHGQCTPKFQQPDDCKKYSRTPLPGVASMCYVDQQCKAVNAPPRCCFAIEETPGFCQDICTTTPLPLTVDPRCFVDQMCGDTNKVCCWIRGAIHGQCTPKSDSSADCMTGPSMPPGVFYCYQDKQCKLVGAPSKCCGANGETFGQCKNSCEPSGITSTFVDPRCFVDQMCEDSNKVCCWTEGAIHGQCTPKSSAPADCGKYSRTPLPGVASMCYVDQQCKAVNAPPRCCFAIEETPGFCRNDCSATQPPSTVDPRCFVDAMCGDKNFVCCWTSGALHGQCTPKAQQPSNCKEHEKPMKPGVTYCYTAQQCQLVGAKPLCCDVDGESFGHCGQDCTTGEKCFYDEACDYPGEVCCWHPNRSWGFCLFENRKTADCDAGKVTDAPGRIRCFEDTQCQRMNQPSKCCQSKTDPWGYCQSNCNATQPPSTDDPRCFVDEMCKDPTLYCCWNQGSAHGMCTPREQIPDDCDKYVQTPPPGISALCYTDQHCRFAGAPSKCCFANGNIPGWCQDNCDTRNKQHKPRSRLQSIHHKPAMSKPSIESKKSAKLAGPSSLALACSLDAQCTVLPEKYTKCCLNNGESIGYCCSL